VARKTKTRNRPVDRSRSSKAGRPPADVPTSARNRRRRKSATVAVKKDTMLAQTERTRAWWPGKRREKKR